MTSVPAIAIALGPLVLLKIAPARNPERRGVTGSGTGVQASIELHQYSTLIELRFTH